MAVTIPIGGLLADRRGRPDGVIAVGLLSFALLLIAALDLFRRDVAGPATAAPRPRS